MTPPRTSSARAVDSSGDGGATASSRRPKVAQMRAQLEEIAADALQLRLALEQRTEPHILGARAVSVRFGAAPRFISVE